MTAAATIAPTATCCRCGLSTTVPSMLKPIRRGMSARQCPRCAEHQQFQTSFTFYYLGLGLSVIFLVLWEFGDSSAQMPPSLQYLLAFLLGFPISMVLHEMSHALVAAAVGFRVYGLRIGTGPRLCRLRWRRRFLDLRILPLGEAAPPFHDPTMMVGGARSCLSRQAQARTCWYWHFYSGGPRATPIFGTASKGRRLPVECAGSTQHLRGIGQSPARAVFWRTEI